MLVMMKNQLYDNKLQKAHSGPQIDCAFNKTTHYKNRGPCYKIVGKLQLVTGPQ